MTANGKSRVNFTPIKGGYMSNNGPDGTAIAAGCLTLISMSFQWAVNIALIVFMVVHW